MGLRDSIIGNIVMLGVDDPKNINGLDLRTLSFEYEKLRLAEIMYNDKPKKKKPANKEWQKRIKNLQNSRK